MTELIKPIQKPRFATGGSAAITEPPEFKKDLGWIVEAPPHNFFNWLHKYTYDWLQYLESKQDVDLGSAVPTTLEIASGTITPTGGVHSVDTEASAGADDLTNIATTNLDNGRLLLLRTANDSRDVTVKHAAGGAGQIFLRRGVDLVLNESALWILLIRDGADWVEVFARPYLQDDPNPTLTANLVAGAAGLDIGSLAQRFDEVFATTSDALTTLTQRVDRRDVGTLKIGDTNADQIDIGNATATVNIYGDVINVETTNAQVTDKLITINKGGASASGGLSGHEIEENSVITGYFKTTSDRNAWQMKAPNNANIANLKPAPNVPLVGMLPISAVIAIFPHMTGAYNCTATTAADANGFVQCNGQVIADATSPMNGQTVPNINDSAFLMGTTGTTSSSTASANTKDFSHTHSVTSAVSINNNHTVTNNAVVSGNESITLSHSVTNNAVTSGDESASLTHSVTQPVISNHAAHTHIAPPHYHGMGAGATLNITASGVKTVTGTVGGSDGTHTHTITDPGHTHIIQGIPASGGSLYISKTAGAGIFSPAGGADSNTTGITINSTNSGHGHGHSLTAPNHTHIAGNFAGVIGLVTNGVDGNSTTAMVTSSGGPTTHALSTNVAVAAHAAHSHTVTSNVAVAAHGSHTHSVTSNVAVAAHTVTNGTVTSGSSLSSAFDVRPKYIACRYIMRIA